MENLARCYTKLRHVSEAGEGVLGVRASQAQRERELADGSRKLIDRVQLPTLYSEPPVTCLAIRL